MKTITDKLYENFSIAERINLTMAAMARQDYDEADKLRSTCEKKVYRMNNDAYDRCMESAQRIAVSFHGMCTVACAEIELALERYHSSLDCKKYYEHGVEWALKVSGNAENRNTLLMYDNDKISILCQQAINHKTLFEKAVGRLKAANRAFKEICVEKNIAHEHLIQWFEIDKALPMMSDYLALDLVEDEELYHTIKKGLIELWEG